MIELIIERWSYPDGRTEFFWSLWQDGARIKFSDRHGGADTAEAEGREFCRSAFGREPEKITHL